MATNETTELGFHTSGFVVKVNGTWTEPALEQFRHFLELRKLAPTSDELQAVLEHARESYRQGLCRLSLCGGEPCRAKIGFDVSDAALQCTRREAGMPIVLTGCQGPCKQAPVLSLRVADRSQFFAGVTLPQDWQAIVTFAREANAAGSLMVDAGLAEPFRFDPVHDHSGPSAGLKPLQFLVGHFRGEGKYAMASYRFHKEVIGTREAGGRFIALRMGVSYPLLDGRTDNHNALVIVGSEPASGCFIAHAYTDAGLYREYSIEKSGNELKFADLPPGHENQWRRAQKILRPTPAGFDERLEVDGGAGFVPYYEISLRRTTKNGAS